MSDVPTDDDDKQSDSPVIQELREKAKNAEAAELRAQTAERKLLLHEAGLGSLSDKQLKALEAAHEGDWTADSLKATAAELNFTKQDQQAEPKVPQEELEAHRRVAEAANGTPEPPSDLDAAIAGASTKDELSAVLRQAGLLVEQ